MAKMCLALSAVVLTVVVTVDATQLLPFPVIDAHTHSVSPSSGLQYTWAQPPASLNRTCPCRPPCFCDFSLDLFDQSSASSLNVTHSVFCEVAAVPEDWLKEAQWIQAGGGTTPGNPTTRFGAILAQTPPGFGLVPVSEYSADLDKLAALPLMRGVRIPAFFSAVSPPNATMVAALNELARRKWVADINPASIITTPDLLPTLAKAAPDLQIVVEHLGNPFVTSDNITEWKGAVAKLAAQPNIVGFFIGGVVQHVKSPKQLSLDLFRPWIVAAVEAFSYDRVIYEGNWFFNNLFPEWIETYGLWASYVVTSLRDAGATDTDLEKLFHANSKRVYSMAD